jgi:competence protein ComFC
MRRILRTLGEGFLSGIFPEKCSFCNSMPSRSTLDHGICPSCEQRIVYLRDPDISEIVADIKVAPHQIFCACRYGDVIKKAVVGMKYSGKGFLGKPLSWVTYKGVNRSLDFSKFDFICAVPSSRVKLRERGFNQAELLAQGLSSHCGVPYKKDVLRKSRDMTSQSLLNIEQRLKSVSGTFEFNPSCNISGKNIILLDDVLTTGATIIECAKILIEMGAAKVAAVVLATGKRNV